MKEQLSRKVRKVCLDMGAAAAEKADELVAEMEAEFDKRVASGKAEIDAYRELLGDIDKIEAMLRDLSKAEATLAEREERASRAAWNKKLTDIRGKINGLWWLMTVIFYFLVSFAFGDWHLTWLIFLSSSIGSMVIDMLFDYNKGVPKNKVFGKIHGILWISIVIAYFLISFATGAWGITWLIFVLGAVIESIVGVVRKIVE